MDVREVYKMPRIQATTVTFLLTDVQGSTERWQRNPEAMRLAIQQHDRLVEGALRQHGGFVLTERGEGDSFFALFARAGDAVEAALDIQLQMQGQGAEATGLRIRIAIHTGEAGEDYRGPDVNRCARLRGAGHGGQVLISGATETLVRESLPEGVGLRDLGLQRLPDLREPMRVFQLTHPDLPNRLPALRAAAAERHNLPLDLTSFVGREVELTRVGELLRTNRLLTLVGAGGAGKTRLALRSASAEVEAHADGVWLVDLGAVSDPELVGDSVAAVLAIRDTHGSRPIDALTVHLKDRDVLLVFDNCEHLLDGCAKVIERLLHEAPKVSVLATSREPLRIYGEAVLKLSPLTGAEAVQLFRERSTASLEPWTGMEPVVWDICARVDGIPLAVELAARRAGTLGLIELSRRLEDSLRLLTSGARTAPTRQQTLRATIDWSYELLDGAEQSMFRRLAVFQGGFDLDAAESLVRDLPALELVLELVDKSLVAAEPMADGGMRYRLLDTLRSYAWERLEAEDDANEVRRCHLEYYASMGERAYNERHQGAAGWAVRLETEHGNFSTALEFAAENNPAVHVALAGSVLAYWKGTPHHAEGRRHLMAALAQGADESPARARAQSVAGLLAVWQSDYSAAGVYLESSLEYWRHAGDPVEAGLCLDRLGWMHFMNNEELAAKSTFQEELELGRQLSDDSLIARAEGGLVQVAVAVEVDKAKPIAERYLALGSRIGDTEAIHFGHHFLGDCALQEGDCLAAEHHYGRSLAAALEIYDPIEATFEIQGLAMAAAGLGRPQRALRLRGAVEALWEQLGAHFQVRFWDELLERYLGAARGQLGPDASSTAWREGRALSFQEVAQRSLDITAD